MKTLTIKKIVLLLSMFCLGDQIKDENITSQYFNTAPKEPAELRMLKQSVEDYSSKIELLQSEIELKLHYKKYPFKILKPE